MADEDDSIDSDLQFDLDHAPENYPPGGYLAADPDPTDADCSGLAVRLDVAVIAVRLTAWKVVTRIYPKKRKTVLGQIRTAVRNFAVSKGITAVAKKLAGAALKEAAEQIASFVNDLLSFLQTRKNAQEVEALIRGQCHVVRRQLLAQALPKQSSRRRKVVSTRHVKHK